MVANSGRSMTSRRMAGSTRTGAMSEIGNEEREKTTGRGDDYEID